MILIGYTLLYLVLNQPVEIFSFANDAEYQERSEEDSKNTPADHIIPYSEHEDPPEPPTKPKYRPGEWAKPLVDKDIPLDFVPLQIYAQVRRTQSVKRVPREESLKDAKTDEEMDAAARLKEAVTNKKVHTIYTEEGYEDAAYDHGGHIRNANFQEKYKQKAGHEELNKNKLENQIDHSNDVSPSDSEEFGNYYDDSTDPIRKSSTSDGQILEKKRYDSPKKRLRSSDINPKAIVEMEINKLEKDLENEDKEAAKGAETDVPENLKDLGVVDEKPEGVSDKNDSAESYDAKKMNKRVLKCGEVSEECTSIENTSHSPIPSKYDKTPHEILDTDDETTESTTIDYGKIFWDFYKTEKYEISTEKNIITTTLKTSDIPEKHIFSETKANGYPSLSTIYESWKSRGIEQMFEQSSPNAKEINELVPGNPLESTSKTINEIDETTTILPKKPDYVTIIRPPKDNNIRETLHGKDELDKDFSKFNIQDHSQNSIEPAFKKTRAVKNHTVTILPAKFPSGQVTYANSFPDIYGSLNRPSSMSDESESSQEIDQGSLEYGSPTRPQRPQYNQLNLLQMAGMNLRRYLRQLMHLLPPSPIGYSEYADYGGRRRSGTAKPQRDSRPVVSSYLRPPQRFTRKLLEHVSKKSIKGERKSGGHRKKRSNDLLDEAPKIVEKVVDEEIQFRFPKESEDSDELVQSEEQGKVEVEVPDVNSDEAIEVIRNYQEPSVLHGPQEVVDSTKYSNYYNEDVPMSSALKYIINPVLVPKKTHGGTEFYDSRHNYLQCPEIEPDITKVAPNGEEDDLNQTTNENLPRLKNLGDKLSCLRAMYFDHDPLDNPLFNEELIESPKIPKELFNDSHRMASSFPKLGSDHEARVFQKVSRRPEIINLHTSSSNKKEITRSNSKNEGTPCNRKTQKRRFGYSTTSGGTPYQKHVYEDVMETIKNLSNMHRSYVGSVPFPQIISNKSSVRSSVNISKDLLESIRPQSHSKNWGYRHGPYKTNKVTYTTKPRPETLTDGGPKKIVGYFKTVRVNKRSLDSSAHDLQVQESRNIANTNRVLRRRGRNSKIIESTSSPIVVGEKASRKIYTISDRLRYSRPRNHEKYGKFAARNSTSTATTRRNEPRYSPFTNTEEIHNITSTEKDEQNIETDNDSRDNLGEEAQNRTARYDVHEEVQEDLSSQNPNSAEETVQTESHEENENDEHIKNEQVERPSEQYPKNSEENSDDSAQEESIENSSKESQTNENSSKESQADENSSKESQIDENSSKESQPNEASSQSNEESYTDEEKNMDEMSESEKEFNKFGYRPPSFPENYFNDYSYIRSKINKPDFHPKFELPDYERKSAKESQQAESDEMDMMKSKYVFPWDQDKDLSDESRSSGLLRYEYPWEKRERLLPKRNRERAKFESFENDDGESSGTMSKLMRIYPWEHYDVPSKKIGMKNRFFSEEIFDNHKMGSELVPKKISSKMKNIGSRTPNSDIEKIEQSVINFVESEMDRKRTEDITTTFKPQIPATEATAPRKRKTTTPMTETTTQLKQIRYTIKPKPNTLSRSQRRHGENRSPTFPTIISNEASAPKLIRRRGRLPEASEAENNRSARVNVRSRSRMSTTTSATPGIRSRTRRKLKKSQGKPEVIELTPVKTVEHRSETTEEEIITETQRGADTPGNHTSSINRLSITTKETPDHIYRIEKIDNNGVKGKVITIIPNNNTNSYEGASDNITMDDIEREEDERNEKAMADAEEFAIDSYPSGGGNNIYFLANIMQHSPLPLPSTYENEQSETSSEEDSTTESEIKFTKEPDQRLYTFVDD